MTAKLLIEKMSPLERTIHATMLVDRICEQTSQLPPEERALSCDFLRQVFDEFEEPTQIGLANKLARAPAAPIELIADLADRKTAISVPILRWSPVIDDHTMIVVASRAGIRRLLAIATREALSSEVTEAVLENAEADVIVALARNPAARFSNASLKILSWRTIGNPALEEALCLRDELPDGFLQKVMRSVVMRTDIQFASKSNEFDARTIRLMLRTIESPDMIEAVEAFQPDEAVADQIAALVATGRMNEGALVNLVSGGGVDAVACGLAAMAKLDAALARRVMQPENGTTLAIIARSLDLSASTYRAMLALVRGRKSNDPTLGADMDAFGEIPTQLARKVVTLHRRRRQAALRRRNERQQSDGTATAAA